MHEHEWRKKRWTSVRGDKFVSNERPVSGINTRWGIRALGSSISRFLMNNGCRLVSVYVHLRTLRFACFALAEVNPWPGHKKRSGSLQPSDCGRWELALFVLRKCHNWKTIE